MSVSTMEAPVEVSQAQGFEHVHLKDVDPSFTTIEPGYYDLRVISGELFTGTSGPNSKRPGSTYQKVNFQFAVTNSTKFNGRRVFERNLFYNDYTLKILRRIMDATGIQQGGDFEEWLKELSSQQPTLKLMVAVEPDVNFDGTPNPKNLKADGTPGDRSFINWKAGVQSGS